VMIIAGGFSPVASLIIPTGWIYDYFALRVAFGSEQAAREHITVRDIEKPSTVTFSNGKRLDVGAKPAVISSIFRIAATIPLVVGYIFLIRRYSPKWFRAGISEHFRKSQA